MPTRMPRTSTPWPTICFTDNGVEIRIPWQLLNFSNPSEMMIHDDYYEHYGVENLHIDEMYVGVAQGDGDGVPHPHGCPLPWRAGAKT